MLGCAGTARARLGEGGEGGEGVERRRGEGGDTTCPESSCCSIVISQPRRTKWKWRVNGSSPRWRSSSTSCGGSATSPTCT